MEDHERYQSVSAGTVRLMAVVRYAIILLGILFLLIRLFRQPEEVTSIAVIGPYAVFVAAAIINTIYLGLLLLPATAGRLFPLAVVQCTVDAFIVSGLVFFTGGIFSAITSFYFAVILTASIVLSRRLGIVYASLSIILLSGIHILYASRTFPVSWQTAWPYLEWRISIFDMISKLLFHAAAFYTVAILGGTLGNMLRSVRILYIEILENISDGILVVDSSRRVTFSNPAFQKLFGLGMIQPSADAAGLFTDGQYTPVREILEGNLERCGEFTFSPPEGNPVHINIKATALVGRRQELKGHVILFEDITAAKQMEKAMIRMDRYRALVEMSAGIAHEIRNPLASIRGCAEELARSAAIPESDARLFSIIKEESDRLTDIISDFFNYMKESPPQKEPHDLAGLINDSIATAQSAPSLKNVSFETDLETGLVIALDRGQWKQVFLNLFLNAVEAMTNRVMIRARRVPVEDVSFARKFVPLEELLGGVTITVSDYGQGIPAGNISDIFIPFYTTKTNGVGVGLSIVNRIVRSHGGIVEVHSAAGQGTSFVILLPLYKENLS